MGDKAQELGSTVESLSAGGPERSVRNGPREDLRQAGRLLSEVEPERVEWL